MIRMEPMDYKKELPNLHLLPQSFGDSISAIKVEGWASSGEFTEMVFEDEFIGNRMRPEWRWEDPKGGGSWAERQGYLEMRTDPGQDLWHGADGNSGDMSAPRLLTEIPWRLRRRNPHANHATTQRTRRYTDMEESKQVPSFGKNLRSACFQRRCPI